MTLTLNSGEMTCSLSKESSLTSNYLKNNLFYRIKSETHYSEEELKNLKTLYCQHAEVGKGLNYSRFAKLMGNLMNIENHPFFPDLFLTFDKHDDGLVDFKELVVGLNVLEKGDFDQKCELCFRISDNL